MVYLLYSEGFRLGGSNSARAAASASFRSSTAGHAQELRGRAEEPVVRRHRAAQRVAVLHGMGRHPAQHLRQQLDNPWWMRGTFNGGKAEQKGAEIDGSWSVTENFSLDASAFLAEPEFSEDSIYPDGGRRRSTGRTVMPISPEEKYWSRPSTYCRTSWA